jgi:hypothetical protein
MPTYRSWLPYPAPETGLGPASNIDVLDGFLREVEHRLRRPPMRIGVRGEPQETFSLLMAWARHATRAGTHRVRALPTATPLGLLFVPTTGQFPVRNAIGPRHGVGRRGTSTLIEMLGADQPPAPNAHDVLIDIVTPTDFSPYDECIDVREIAVAAPAIDIEPLAVVLHHSRGVWYDDLLYARGPVS